ncbi:MAG: hypothetical protein WAT39_26260, partial [Planctomycetota bacterium]
AAVNALLAMPNGDLFAGGSFATAGGNAAARVARWNGSTWAGLGAGVNSPVTALALLTNGDVLVAGGFASAGGSPALMFATWNGTAFTAVPGLSSSGGIASAVTPLPGGQFAAVGLFPFPGGATASVVVSSTAGVAPLPAPPGNGGSLRAMVRLANGDLVVGGFAVAGAGAVVRWNGAAWSNLGPGTPGVVNGLALTATGDLVAGGARSSGAYTGPTAAVFDGAAWNALGGPQPPAVRAMVRLANGDLVLGGTFTSFGGVAANHVVRRSGTTFVPLGAGVDGPVDALAVAPDGAVLVGGAFANAGGGPANRVARWTGTAWTSLGSGPSVAPVELAAGTAGQVLARGGNQVHWFDGASWSTITPPNGPATAIAAAPEGDFLIGGLFFTPLGGSGTVRFAQGVFSFAANQPLLVTRFGHDLQGRVLGAMSGAGGSEVWRLTGNSWTQIGSVFPYGLPLSLSALPNGDPLAIASPFQNVSIVGRFDGAAWVPLSTEVIAGPYSSTFRLAATSTREGDVVVAGGVIAAANQVSLGLAVAAPTCPAAAATFGTGCVGDAGPMTLTTTTAPWIGGTFASMATGLPAGSLGVHAIGVASASVPLPGGAPGCSLFVNPILLDVLLPAAGQAAATFAVPRNLALAGMALRTQVVGVEIGALGAIVRLTSSNALDLTVGAL